MTLKEYLSTIKEKDYNIKLGSGSGFIYCGKIRPASIRLISAHAKRNAETELRSRKKFILEYEERRKNIIRDDMVENINRWLTEYEWTEPEPGVFAIWWTDAEKHVQRLKRQAESQVANLTERLENWKDLMAREVLEYYPSTTEPETMIIIIEGEEIGQSWTTKEFKEKKISKEAEE